MYAKGVVVIAIILLSSTLLVKSGLEENILNRKKRQLLFPNSTLLQMNIGVATPTPVKTIFFNWALQLNFQLPWNRTQIPVDIFGANSGYVGTARKKREIDYEEDEIKLSDVYKHVEEMLISFGHNGTSCVLRTLCQLGAEPLHSVNNEDLLHEIATFVLNPLNDVTSDKNEGSNKYIEAYETGRHQENCYELYNKCYISLTDMFTILH